ncbi:MAG TPA: hypothetical protein VHE34_03870 [Puia sp.]|uniref:hypothetical protein n=1 Tax=Puia sp. TaxID=2045100 RepID=UPI002C97A38B|nr:hypothetical protein [Puia sp.]HVU94332.1 hypothetical protein [Puia sp.]
MKYAYFRRLPALLLLATLLSCGKSNSIPGTASLTIVNAVAGSNPLVTNFSGTQPIEWYSNAPQIGFGQYHAFNNYSGLQPLALYQYPDTLPKSSPLFSFTLNLPLNSIRSLFLIGTTGAPDTLVTADAPPYHPVTDSSMGIRFVNLSPGSAPVSVDIQGQANGSEVGSLAYKGLSAFKIYPATSTVTGYNFEFRDAASGTLLASYALTPSPYRNYTIALEGLPGPGGATVPQAAYLINNY